MEMLTFAIFFNAVSKQNKETRGPEPLYGTVAEVSAPSVRGCWRDQCFLDGGGAHTHPA